jgi:hypothetical protein
MGNLLQETPDITTLLPDRRTAVVLIKRGPEPPTPPRGRVELIEGGHVMVLNPAAPAASAEPPDEWPWSALAIPGLASAGGAAMPAEGELEIPPPAPARVRGRARIVEEAGSFLIIGD